MKFTIFFSILLLTTLNQVYSQWKEILMRDTMGLYLASSELDEVSPFEGMGKYGAHKLCDNDPATAWVEGEHMSISLMDVSQDKEWAQIDYLYTAEGLRVEEYSKLYSVRYLTPVDEKILKTIYGMYGFVEKDGKIYIDTADGMFDLEDILKKFLEFRKE